MLTAFYDEEVVQLGDDTLRLAVDFRAIDLMEHIVGDSDAITPATLIVEHVLTSIPCPVSILCKVLYALLRRHHEGISLDVCLGVMASEHSVAASFAMQTLLRRAFNFGEPERQAKGKNPRKPRGASKPSSKSGSRSGA
jgi:hypothetical protein